MFKRWLLGDPLKTAQAVHERLSKRIALAVFSSDALSSVAYATEEILLVLILAGTARVTLSVPISFVIVLLLIILTVSYRQIIVEYPAGGGAYIVARSNLGSWAGLTAAAALIIDYTDSSRQHRRRHCRRHLCGSNLVSLPRSAVHRRHSNRDDSESSRGP